MGAEKLTWRCIWEATLKCSYRELPLNPIEPLSVNHRHVCMIFSVKKIFLVVLPIVFIHFLIS